jgi:hypothetical protein
MDVFMDMLLREPRAVATQKTQALRELLEVLRGAEKKKKDKSRLKNQVKALATTRNLDLTGATTNKLYDILAEFVDQLLGRQTTDSDLSRITHLRLEIPDETTHKPSVWVGGEWVEADKEAGHSLDPLADRSVVDFS